MIDHEKVERLMKRCQIGCRGRNALDDAHDILADCYGTLGLLDAEVRRLRARLELLQPETPEARCMYCGLIGTPGEPCEVCGGEDWIGGS